MEITKRAEILEAEKHFQNHHARLDVYDETLSILSWKQPGTQAYAVRAVFDGMHVYISGDLGSAVVHLTEKADLKALSSYWKSPSYFIEKIVCSTDKYDFDYEEAKKELEEHIDTMLYNYSKRRRCFDDDDMEDYKEDVMLTKAKVLDGFNEDNGLCGNPIAVNEWSALDPEYFEWMPHAGRRIHKRIWLWLAAFEMAYKALKEE